jgi:hypothetical protein
MQRKKIALGVLKEYALFVVSILLFAEHINGK